MPTSSSTWLEASARLCAASASIDEEPLSRPATSFAAATARSATSATTTVRVVPVRRMRTARIYPGGHWSESGQVPGLGVPVDRNRLPRDHAGGIGGEEQAEVGDLRRLHPARDRLAADVLPLDLLGGHAAPGRLALDDPAHALPVDRAGADRVHADVVRAELDRERLGQADHAPLGGDVGRAHSEPVLPGGRGGVDDAAAAGALHRGYDAGAGAPVACQVDGEAAVPVGGVDVLHQRRRPGDAGVVDEHVELAAAVVEHAVEPGIEGRAVGNVDLGGEKACGGGIGNGGAVRVAEVDSRTGGGEGRGDRAADARTAGGHSDVARSAGSVGGHEAGDDTRPPHETKVPGTFGSPGP